MNRFGAELRATVDGNTLTGHAVVWDSIAELPHHYESMTRAAIDRALESDDDVKALFNHNPTMVLASTRAKTLRLETDSTGLRFEADLPDTSYARDLKELVARNDISAMSFGFLPGAYEWRRAPDGRQLRAWTAVKRLLDVSPVSYPAYEGTEVYLRALDFSQLPRVTARGQLVRLQAAANLRK